MRTLKIECTLTYDNETMHDESEDSLEWFYDILTKYPLLLHSNELGDTVGDIENVKVYGDVTV